VPMGLADWGEQGERPQHRLILMLAVSVRLPAVLLDVEDGMVSGTSVPAWLQPAAISWLLLRGRQPAWHLLRPPFILFQPAFPSNRQPPP